MGKAPPTDIKKIDDRCKEYIRELDSLENLLMESTHRLNSLRNDLKVELHKSVTILLEMELARLTFFKDGLARLCQSGGGMLDNLESLILDFTVFKSNNNRNNNNMTTVFTTISNIGTVTSPPIINNNNSNNSNSTVDMVHPSLDIDTIMNDITTVPYTPTEITKWKEVLLLPEVESSAINSPEYSGKNLPSPVQYRVTSKGSLDINQETAALTDLFVHTDRLRMNLDVLKDGTQVRGSIREYVQ